MTALVPISHRDDVLRAYRGTPVADLVTCQNLRSPHRATTRQGSSLGYMDSRIASRIPDNFAYILHTGGRNLPRIEFKISYAVAVGGVRTICPIGQDRCGMAGQPAQGDVFEKGLVEKGGWARRKAEPHFSAVSESGDPTAFALTEARRPRRPYPRLMVAPPISQVREGLFSQMVQDKASGVIDGH